jgi:hypothetical protein
LFSQLLALFEIETVNISVEDYCITRSYLMVTNVLTHQLFFIYPCRLISQHVMSSLTSTLLVAGLLLVAGVSVGTSAFTTAEVDRQANVDVVADDAGLLGLTDGNSGNLVYQNSSDQLAIDFTNGSADGANTDALFRLGDPADPSGSQAFIITNNDAESHVINASYNASTSDASTPENLKFEIYDSESNKVGTISASGDTASWDASANTAYNVVVTVDTGHSTTVLTSDDDLSGTLEFRVDDTAVSVQTQRGQLNSGGGNPVNTTNDIDADQAGNTTETLVVAEINADAEGDDRENLNDEYVVFENTGDSPIDMSRWTIEDDVGQSYTVPDGFILNTNETVTLRTGDGTDTDTELYRGSKSPIWNNGGDTVIVFDDDGNRILGKSY